MSSPHLASASFFHVIRVEGDNDGERQRTVSPNVGFWSEESAAKYAEKQAAAEPGVRFYVVKTLQGFLATSPVEKRVYK